MKKIIIHLLTNTKGGVISVVKNLVKYQVSNNDIPYVFLYHESKNAALIEEFNEIGVKCFIIQKKIRLRGCTSLIGVPIKKVNSILKKNENIVKIDNIVIHAHNISSVGLFNPLMYHKNYVVTIHGRPIKYDARSKILNKAISFVLQLVGASFIGVSEDTSRFINTSLNINEHQIKTVYNGVEKIDYSINHYKINKYKFNIGFIGDINSNKGWHIIIDAVKKIKINKENIELYFVGDGPDMDLLKKSIEENSLEDYVKLLGFVDKPESYIIPYLNLTVLPSISEGLPMSIIESMAYGIPSVVSNVGGVPEIVIDNVNGMLLEKISSEELYSKIHLVYNDFQLYTKLKENSFKTYQSYLTTELMGQQYNSVYEEILKRRQE